VEIREDVKPELHRFRGIREKHRGKLGSDEELAASLIADDRVLLAITPSGSPSSWTTVGLD
jgi:hypothetical protein